jgi:hypothetical protein
MHEILGEHAAILDALTAGDDHAALAGLAHHLARTALWVLSDCAPDYPPRAVPHAVALAEGADPAALRAGAPRRVLAGEALGDRGSRRRPLSTAGAGGAGPRL